MEFIKELGGFFVGAFLIWFFMGSWGLTDYSS